MLSQSHYLIRSKIDGKYLTARVGGEDEPPSNYLLLFREHFEALSYLNTHAAEYVERLGIESIATSQLKSILQRWGFQGIGLVEDPLLPQIQFLSYEQTGF